ncbi:MAG: hypothetical protein ABI702_16440 [Burkholderiales bacterium]
MPFDAEPAMFPSFAGMADHLRAMLASNRVDAQRDLDVWFDGQAANLENWIVVMERDLNEETVN